MCYCKNLSGLQLKARRESGQSRERCPERTGPQREVPARSAGRTWHTSGLAGFLTTPVKHKASGRLLHEVLLTQNNLKVVDASYSEEVKPRSEASSQQKEPSRKNASQQHPEQVPQGNAWPSHQTPQRNMHESRDPQCVLPGKRLAAVDAGALPPGPRVPAAAANTDKLNPTTHAGAGKTTNTAGQPGPRRTPSRSYSCTRARTLTHAHTHMHAHTHALTCLLASDKVTLCPVRHREMRVVTRILDHSPMPGLHIRPDGCRSNEKSKAGHPG